jgi:hypothetical protein
MRFFTPNTNSQSFSFVLMFSTILFLVWNVNASELRDPTQLPNSMANVSGDSNYMNSQQYGPVLQSIMLSTTGKAAIISGERVALNKKYRNGATLIALTEQTATLKNVDGSKTVLKMGYPDPKQGITMKKSAESSINQNMAISKSK